MKKEWPFTDEEFKHIYSRVPRLCVEIIIKTDHGVLMTLRDIEPYKDSWQIPGGTVRLGETIEAATKRVAFEELGIVVDIIGLAGYQEYPSDPKLRGWGWPIAIQMFCSIKSDNFILDRQARDMAFFKKVSDVPENTIEEHKKILERLLIT